MIRTEKLFFVVCDQCGAEHHDASRDSALGARIAAGIVGWRHRAGKPGRRDVEARPAQDLCDACARAETGERR